MRDERNIFEKYPALPFFIIALIVGTVIFGIYYWRYNSKLDKYNEMYEAMNEEAQAESDGNKWVAPTYSLSKDFMSLSEFLKIADNKSKYGELIKDNAPDMAAYLKVNSDVCSYLFIPGTKVSYPILYSVKDNDYYLNHNIDGTKGYPGCLYVENCNCSSMQDCLTVIYGHNMRNGSMFGDLDYFKQEEYRESHPYFFIYTAEGIQIYQIVLCSTFSNEHIFSADYEMIDKDNYNFTGLTGDEPYQFEQMVTEYNSRDLYNGGYEVGEGDQFVVLSTCAQRNKRYLVVGKRIV